MACLPRTRAVPGFLAVCCFSLFMAQLDATAVNVALPVIGRDLHAGITGLQWVVDGFVLAILASTVGWRAIFWINLPVGLAGLALATLYVPESRAAMPRPADLPGQAGVIAFVATLTYALIQAPGQSWNSPRTLALFAVAGCALAAFTVTELRSAAPMIDVRLLSRPALAAAIIAALLAYLGRDSRGEPRRPPRRPAGH